MIFQILIRFADIFILIATIFLIIYSIYLYQRKWIQLLRLAFKLPGPYAFPFIGNGLNFACKAEELLERAVKVVKPYVNLTPMRLWLGPMLCVIISKPRDLEIILNSQQAIEKGFSYKFLKPFIGEGLISGSGPIWKSHRKIVAPILTQKILDKFLIIFDRHSRNLMRELKSLSNGREIDILGPIELCTANIVCETVLGCDDTESMLDSTKEFLHHSAEMYRVAIDRVMKIWLYPDFIYKFTENYKINLKGRKILTNFVQQSQDTLAVISSFAILMLGIHEKIQDDARIEVMRIFADNSNSMDIEKLSQLKFIEKIVKETLRLFPIAPIMARTTIGEIKLDSCTIPESCQIILIPFLTHRNSEYFHEPEKFNPERFDPADAVERHPYSFIPFSAGPMGCIGQRFAMMSLKTIIANFLRNYKITSQVQLKEIQLKTDISIRSKNGYKVSLKLI
ncbi:cytochrome P450 4C1-like isoform X2 [Leptopilina boulardi]|uniref:cytochrome P450 4C1-like isoform X2 n=1 Tax=Leptopilina boulardi TaxID=63433 RepID=UPI0021F67F6F|nr:cytochrome P450 4C1-like isoform X2 [Leptopilina boulardi]